MAAFSLGGISCKESGSMNRSIETLAEIALTAFKEAGGHGKRGLERRIGNRIVNDLVETWKVDMKVWTSVAESVRDAVLDDVNRIENR